MNRRATRLDWQRWLTNYMLRDDKAGGTMLYGTKERLTTYLDPDLVKRLDEYRQTIGLSRSDVSRIALMDYLDAAKERKAEPVTSDLT